MNATMTEKMDKKKQEVYDACLAGELLKVKRLWVQAAPDAKDLVAWALELWQELGPAPIKMTSRTSETRCAVLRWLISRLAAHSPKIVLIGAPGAEDQHKTWTELTAAWSSGELEKWVTAGFARAIENGESPSALTQLYDALEPTPESLWQYATKLWHPDCKLKAAETRTLDWMLDRIAEKSPELLRQMQADPTYAQMVTAWARDEFCEVDAQFDRACAAGVVKRADALYRENFAALGLEALERNLRVDTRDFAPTQPPRASAMNCWLLDRIAVSSPKRIVLLSTLRPDLSQTIKSWACQ